MPSCATPTRFAKALSTPQQQKSAIGITKKCRPKDRTKTTFSAPETRIQASCYWRVQAWIVSRDAQHCRHAISGIGMGETAVFTLMTRAVHKMLTISRPGTRVARSLVCILASFAQPCGYLRIPSTCTSSNAFLNRSVHLVGG